MLGYSRDGKGALTHLVLVVQIVAILSPPKPCYVTRVDTPRAVASVYVDAFARLVFMAMGAITCIIHDGMRWSRF